MRWDGVSNGLKVSAGAVIQRDDLVQYTAQADATSAGGVLRVPVLCSVTGMTGNMDDGETLSLVSPVNGLPSGGLADTITGGFDIEDLEVWRARVLERYYWTPQGALTAITLSGQKKFQGNPRMDLPALDGNGNGWRFDSQQ
jgi:uncharacterized phage protein gp47/JayE